MQIRFDGQVAIVTGAGAGLGRSHAKALASRGAKVVVNELADANGQSSAALSVVEEIEKAGGTAIALTADVADKDQVLRMVESVIERWGRVDILVNNAGILRDKTFSKMTDEDFELVVRVHLIGTSNCTGAVWNIMKKQNYGRIVMTTSSSGMFGNFGQSNYGAAKCGVTGLMNTLCLEGEKYGIRVNTISPLAATQMTEGLMSAEALDLMTPESVSAGLLALCDEHAPNRVILSAGAGGYATIKIFETSGIYLAPEDQTPENVRANFDQILNDNDQAEYMMGGEQTMKFLRKAADYKGIKL